ncbi:peptidase inhibitor family I36 protein [Streptomyces sp. CRN 30]|uniref:peptidase inhibitor family I36 protein n=1 Tax=Streptomyces sp. CRN 30 TaxID=3075613 RepID=UPI002A7F77D1|nr:peptidase inhibitor family I36 protein [Streptomyces sp. CRN 30]
MFSPKAKLRTAAAAATVAVVLIGVGAGTASAADWPPLQEGAYLYSGTGGTGTVTEVDLGDFGTCHTLSQSAKSVQVVNGSASVVVYTGAGCTGSAWASGSLAQSDLPAPALSYRVVSA